MAFSTIPLYEAKETEEESDTAIRERLLATRIPGSNSGSEINFARHSDATSDSEDHRQSLYENVCDTIDIGEVRIYALWFSSDMSCEECIKY